MTEPAEPHPPFKRVRRNSIFGLLSIVIPTLIMLAAYPVLIGHLGAEAVGVYLLATGLSSAWKFVEFGVSAATTKFVSEDLARGDRSAAADIISVSLIHYLVIGALGAVLIWFLAPWLVHIFSVSEEMADDAAWAFRLTGIRFAVFFITTVFVSVFKGLHRFEYAMAVLSILQVITFGGALLGILVADAGLVDIALIGMVANIVMLAVTAIFAARICRTNEIFILAGRPRFQTFRRIIAYGAFMALNGISSSLVQLLQRALVAAVLGPAGVTVFSIAAMLLQRAHQAYAALFEFIVPATSAISEGLANEDTKRQSERQLRRLYVRAMAVSGALSFAAAITLYFVAPYLVHFWLDSEIDNEVILLIRLICPAIAAEGLIQPGYHMLNGLGRPYLNTIFRLAMPVALYSILGLLWVNGLVLEDFAIAQSGAVVLYAAAFVVFIEIVIWRSWIRQGKTLTRSKPADGGNEDDII